MTSTTLTRPLANMSIKLDFEERDRIRAIAAAENRSTHFIMKEAIRQYLDKKEVERRFIDAAKESRLHYKSTKQHITQDEFSNWVDSLQSNVNTPMPVCHI